MGEQPQRQPLMRSVPEPSNTYRLSLQCLADSERWFGDTAGHDLGHHALALAGEVGEFANIVKKIQRGSLSIGDPKVRHHMATELADVYVYLLNLAGMLKIDLEKAYELVRVQNEQRFMEERRARDAAKKSPEIPITRKAEDSDHSA